jgi:uncharacterized protein
MQSLRPDAQKPVQITGAVSSKRWVPSRFNARTDVEGGTLLVYNSYTGAFSGFPSSSRQAVEDRLHKDGFVGPLEGLTKYMFERGFIVAKGVDEFSRMRLMYGQSQYREDALELILLTSEECNFRCVYCYEEFPRGTMEPAVRSATIKLVEARAPRLNRLHIGYFGGEPLLGLEAIREMAPRFVEIADRHSIAFGSNMTTNGYLLTPDVFEDLIQWKIKTFQITLDGAPEDHDTHRVLKGGGGTFETVFNNLNGMRMTKHQFKVSIRVNFDKTNLPRMEQFLSVMAPFKNDPRFQYRFYPIGKWGGPNDGQLETCGMSAERERQRLDVLASEIGYKSESRLPYLKGGSVCYAARPYSLIVGADGKLMKCTIALDTKDYNIVGHLHEDGRAEIDVDKLAKWVAPYFEDDEGCRSCFYVPVCQGSSCPLPRIENGERPCPSEKIAIRSTLESVWAVKSNTARRYSVQQQAAAAIQQGSASSA